MNGIGGIHSFRGPVRDEVLVKMLESLGRRGRDDDGVVLVGNAGFCVSTSYTDSASRFCKQPFVGRAKEVVLWDGRLDNRAELFREFDGEVLESLERVSDVEIVCAAYAKWGEECFGHLIGEFAVSIWDPGTRCTMLARDHSGARTLYYFLSGGVLAWASDLNALLNVAPEWPDIEDEHVAQYLTFSQDSRLTPYKGVFAVQPAHVVTVDGAGLIGERRYWGIDPGASVRFKSDREYEERFLELFSESVASRLRAHGVVVAELSGGLDSSSVVCMADNLLASGRAEATSVETVSVISDGSPTSNERRFVRMVEEHRGKASHLIREDDLPLFSIVDDASCSGLINPLVNSAAVHQGIGQVVRSVAGRVLLSGLGGDELVHSTNDPAPELSDLLAQFRWGELNRRIKVWGPLLRESYGLLLWRCGVLPCLPRRIRGLVAGPPGGYFPDWFKPSFARKFGLRNRLVATEDVFGFRNPGARSRSGSYLSAVRSVATGYRQECGDFDVSYPYLDRRLVEFLLAVPYEQLVRPGESRSLMRRSLVGILPEGIRTRRGKGDPGETVCRAISREWKHLERLFREPRVVEFGYVDKEAVDRAFARARHGVPQGTATLLATVALEVWLRGFETRKRGKAGVGEGSQVVPEFAAV